MGEERRYPDALIILKSPRSLISEAFRNLRTNLKFSNTGRDASTLLVTSTDPKEGKTTISSNLAVSMALDGRRTLLIDSDLRLPAQHKFFDLDNEKGLTSLLVSELDDRVALDKRRDLGAGDLLFLLRAYKKSGLFRIENGSRSLGEAKIAEGRIVGIDHPPEEINVEPFSGQTAVFEEKKIGFSRRAASRELQQIDIFSPETMETPFLDGLLDGYCQKTGIDNLLVMTSGPTPPNPVEMLGSSLMRQLVAYLKARFDLIIFDSPPARSLSDAAVLGGITDGTIIVVRAGKTNRDLIQGIITQFRSLDIEVVGTVINDFDYRSHKYYYYYYYYSNFKYYEDT